MGNLVICASADMHLRVGMTVPFVLFCIIMAAVHSSREAGGRHSLKFGRRWQVDAEQDNVGCTTYIAVAVFPTDRCGRGRVSVKVGGWQCERVVRQDVFVLGWCWNASPKMPSCRS